METFSELTRKFLAVYGTRRLISIFIRFRHLSLSWTSLIHSTPPVLFVDTIFQSTSWFSKWAALDLSFKTLCISLLSIRATCPTSVIPDLNSHWCLVNSAILLCKFLQSSVTYFFLAQIYSSAPCFETPSASVLPLIWRI